MPNNLPDPEQILRNAKLLGVFNNFGNMTTNQGRQNYQPVQAQVALATSNVNLPIYGNVIQIDGTLCSNLVDVVTNAITTNSQTGINPGDVFQITATTVSNILVSPSTNATIVLQSNLTTALSNTTLTSAKVWDCVVPPAGGKVIIKNY